MTALPERDRIELRGLRAFGYHGVFDHERRDGQEFIVTHTFTVLDGDAVLREDTTESIFTPSPPERVHAEIAAAGFSVRQAGERFLILSLA